MALRTEPDGGELSPSEEGDAKEGEEEPPLSAAEIAEAAADIFPPGFTVTAFYPWLAQLTAAVNEAAERAADSSDAPVQTNCVCSFDGPGAAGTLRATADILRGAPLLME